MDVTARSRAAGSPVRLAVVRSARPAAGLPAAVLPAAVLLAVAALTGCTSSDAPDAAGATSGAVTTTGGTAPTIPTTTATTPSATGGSASPGSDGSPGTAGTTASGSRGAGGQPRPETAKPSVAVSSLPPVRTGAPAVPARGVQVVVDKVRQVTVSAEGPGAVAGPGVSVEVRVTNGSGSALDLGGLAVNASYGDDATPAAPSDSPPARPLAGRLAPGAAAAGVYVFTVPRAEASSLRVDVSSDAWPGIVVVRR